MERQQKVGNTIASKMITKDLFELSFRNHYFCKYYKDIFSFARKSSQKHDKIIVSGNYLVNISARMVLI